jgi:hypothetical protein
MAGAVILAVLVQLMECVARPANLHALMVVVVEPERPATPTTDSKCAVRTRDARRQLLPVVPRVAMLARIALVPATSSDAK